MLHQPRRWLPGLVPLALLAGGSIWWKQADIERDLSQRSSEAIVAAGSTIDGKPWAEVSVRGRDVIVTGDAPADGAGIGAAATALQQRGVRQAIADTDLIPAAEPFGWSARREGQTITLSGQVAPDGARQQLVDAARRAVPGGEVSDLMTVARGVPAGAAAAGVLGIEQLGRVASGSATLAGNAFRFTGNAADAAAQGAVAAALATLPQGIARGAVNVAVPGAEPEQRPAPADILPAVPTPPSPPPAADPAPQAATPAPPAPAPDPPPPVPAPAPVVVAAPPPPPAPPPPAVADWSATRGQDGSLLLSGTVASDEARRRIIDAAMASTTGPVIDAMDVAEGLPANVEAKALAALKQLEGVSTGTARIAGTTFSFSGVAATPDAFDSLAAAIRAVGDGFSVGELIVAPPRIDPFTWSARKGEGALTLMGFAPSEAEKTALLAEAGRIAAGARVIDQMRIGSGFPSGVDFGPLSAAALAQLGKLTEGSVQLTGNRLTLAGRAPDFAASVAVRQALAGLPTPITAISDLSLPAAEIPPPVEMPPLSADLIPPPPPPPPPPVVAPAPAAAQAGSAAPVQTTAAPPPPAAPPAPRPDCSTILQTALEGDRILFDYWKAEQRAEHAAVLDRLAAGLKRCAPDERVEVAGHADLHNRTNQNQKLSEDRAALMRDELVRRGVSATMLDVVGYAETRPIAPSHSDESRALNRRVEFHVRPRG